MTSSNGNIFRVTGCYWPFVQGIHWFPVNSPHKGQWRRALMFSLICVLINAWVNNRETGDLRRHRAHYDVILMQWAGCPWLWLYFPHAAILSVGTCHCNIEIHLRGFSWYYDGIFKVSVSRIFVYQLMHSTPANMWLVASGAPFTNMVNFNFNSGMDK